MRELTNGSNVHLLERDTFVLDDVTFLGTTLWTDFNILGQKSSTKKYAAARINDYKKIYFGSKKTLFETADAEEEFRKNVEWLDETVPNVETKKTVILTHFAPSMDSVPEEFHDDILSGGFASNLEERIHKWKPKVWIHGHLHTSYNYHIGDTRIVANPRGYPKEPSFALFAPSFSLKI